MSAEKVTRWSPAANEKVIVVTSTKEDDAVVNDAVDDTSVIVPSVD